MKSIRIITIFLITMFLQLQFAPLTAANELSNNIPKDSVYKFSANDYSKNQYVIVNDKIKRAYKSKTKDIIIINTDKNIDDITKDDIKTLAKDIRNIPTLPPEKMTPQQNLYIFAINSHLNSIYLVSKNKQIDNALYLLNQYHGNTSNISVLREITNLFRTNIQLAELLIRYDYVPEFRDVYNSANYHSPSDFANQIKIFLVLKKGGKYSKEEIKTTLRNTNIVNINGKYYYNIPQDIIEQIKNDADIQTYQKNKFLNIGRIKKYKNYEKTLDENEYADYKKYLYAPVKTPLKQNFEIYQLIKDKNYITERDKKHILSQDSPTPCVTINPKYWQKKNTKVRKVINDKRYSNENKVIEIKERIDFRPANPVNIAKDIFGRTLIVVGHALAATVVLWPIGYYCFVGTGEEMAIVKYNKIW